MKYLSRILVILSVLILPLSQISAQDASGILATNSWTAAFVEMAGGTAEQLAPSAMEHPPEYELKPSDIIKVRGAEIFVYAGYEVLMKTVFESFNKSPDQLLQITTSYAPGVLSKSVLSIAEKIGTAEKAQKNISLYEEQLNSIREQLKAAGLYGKDVIVNFHQEPLIAALGFNIIGTFGPQPLSAGKIMELGKLDPVLIIDNVHNPMAAPLKEVLKKPVIVLLNFPGSSVNKEAEATVSLTDVLLYNGKKLLKQD